MSELANIVAHYLEQIVKRAGLTGFDEMRAEIESAVEADEKRHEKQIVELTRELERVAEITDQPDWRQRR
jgi:hypothetical protein